LRAIGGDDRIERIQRADGGALDDDEFGHILERLRTRS
jgi:hypothetical protein